LRATSSDSVVPNRVIWSGYKSDLPGSNFKTWKAEVATLKWTNLEVLGTNVKLQVEVKKKRTECEIKPCYALRWYRWPEEMGLNCEVMEAAGIQDNAFLLQ
jgi:hypothetical protein